jgi:two-component system, NarL family, response regulator DegU
MSELSLVIADDHPIFLEGMCTLIEIKYPEIRILARANDGLETVEAVREFNPDVLLMDIRMPKLNGLEATRILRGENRTLCIVLLTTFEERGLIEEAIESGANGYLLKQDSIDEVVKSLKAAMNGGLLFPRRIEESPKPCPMTAGQGAGSSNREMAVRRPSPLSDISPREYEVFTLMARNYSNEMIARELFISERTVRNYVSKIYEITGMHNRSQLIIWAVKNKIL